MEGSWFCRLAGPRDQRITDLAGKAPGPQGSQKPHFSAPHAMALMVPLTLRNTVEMARRRAYWLASPKTVSAGSSPHRMSVPRAYLGLQREDPLEERALEQMLVGVSTRNYERSLEPLGAGFIESSMDKSSVSRRFALKTEAQLEAALKKPLTDTDWAAVFIDGLHFADHVVIVVLGVDSSGKKHLLGLREGSTENATLCKELLSDLVERGLPADRALLFVIDGGKGLRKAILEVFGQHEVVQRCQVHKKRNVLDQIPEAKKASVRATMSQAYDASSYEAALTQLKNLVRVLAKDHPGAAASLREGLEETLTVKRLGISGALERTLRTTNPAESLNEGMRRVARRVKRWRNGGMVLRWAAAAALEAQRGFRRLKGHKSMPMLIAALRKHDAELDSVRRSA